MNKATEKILRRLKCQSTVGKMSLPSNSIFPNYSGYGLANVPATILRHFGITDLSTSPLAEDVLGSEFKGSKKVVVLLVDALGYLDLANQMAKDRRLHGFRQLAEGGRFTPITSIFPSTTAAAISTFHTGLPPIQHGITGYRMYMPDRGLIANMIRLSPEHDERPGRLLKKTGDARRLLGVPTVHSRLSARGVKSFCLIQDAICNSGLSEMVFRGASGVVPFVNATDMLVNIRDLVNREPEVPACIWAYWGAVDSLQHRYGSWGPAPEAEVRNFGYSLQRELLEPFQKKAPRQKTTMFLLADHGQVQTNIDDIVDFRRSRKVMNSLVVPPIGTGRSPYLFVRDGYREGVRKALSKLLGNRGVIVDSQVAMNSGLWGTDGMRSEFPNRIGDLIVLMKRSHSLFYPYGPDSRPEQMVGGRHGGLDEQEMLIPLFCSRLGRNSLKSK